MSQYKHGLFFEDQIKENLSEYLKDFKISKTEKWDIPPISVKSFKINKNSKNNRIYFGSLQNMLKINSGFILFLIGYVDTENHKEVIFSDKIYISEKQIKELFKDIDPIQINTYHNLINIYKEGEHFDCRKVSKKIKEKHKTKYFSIDFKIDSKNQRRIQTSISFEKFYEALNKKIEYENKLNIINYKKE